MMPTKSPQFYSQLKQLNEELKNYITIAIEKSPYFDFTPTLLDYIEQFKEIDQLPIQDEENEVPPEPNVDKYEEPDAKFTVKVKLYERARNSAGEFPVSLIGIGLLYVKNIEPQKVQLVVRQEPDMRKVLLNEVVTPNIPVKLLNKAVQIAFASPSGESKLNIIKLGTENDTSSLYDILTFAKAL